MASSCETIRDRNFIEIGDALIRDAESMVDSWTTRAVAQDPERRAAHREDLRDRLPHYIRALGEDLVSNDPALRRRHHIEANEHGRFRWRIGWDLNDVVLDYQLLRIVVMEHLRDVLERDLAVDEAVAIGVHLDDSVSRAVQAFVAHQANQLQQAHGKLNEFLGVLGHELRNPLGTISVALQLARLGRDPSDLEESIRVIDRSVGTMSRLMEDMLDVSRITRGELDVRPGRVALIEIVEAAVRSARPTIEDCRHRLEVVGPPADLELEADPVRLEQVIVNLLTNAAKYTPPGGLIRIAAEREGDRAVVRVRDDGNGIGPELLPTIFDLFVQAPEHRGRGLGIGLALVRMLVERHGGTIAAQSDGPGQGSTFTVRLPACDLGSIGAESDGQPQGPIVAVRSRRILIVDDERDAARMLSTILEGDGHEVRVAFDGASALVEAGALVPDVVLLDLGLPDCGGSEVARRLRDSGLRDSLIVALTGFSPSQWPADHDGNESHFDLMLTKPVAADALARLISEHGRPDP